MTTIPQSQAPSVADRPARRVRPSPWRWVFAAGLALVCCVHAVRPTGVIGDATYLTVSIGAAAAGWLGVTLRSRYQRFPWVCVVLGVTMARIGDILFDVRGLDSAASGASVSDLFWLTSCGLIGVGLLVLLVERDTDRKVDVDGLIDMGSYVVLSLIVVSQVSNLEKIFADTNLSFAEQLTYAAYPLLDATLLAMLVRSVISRRLRGVAGVLLGLGIACALVSDFSLLWVGQRGERTAWQDFGWMAAASLLAMSAWQGRRSPITPSEQTAAQVSDARILIGLAPLLLPGVIELAAYRKGHDTNPVPWLLASVVLVVLAFLRTRRLVGLRDRQEADLVVGRGSVHLTADLGC